ncbi:hypothetical protein SAMN00790413_06441 [Deinococcus hopiensis KR-140]|uniref:Uncharacterized protein n=1 Tax=Deinococcus hopiensis KR-140 TaxID=695939 RepID=A0A1W1VWI0_9DEIO|nr:hypothetical protein [Deinococcus hopiensis]SMB97244.1 hypothetical protein SAMN00790413_06441 [Deinococcus hopiensis KR-140]
MWREDPFPGRLAAERFEHVAHTPEGEELGHAPLHRQSLEPGAVLPLTAYVPWKRRLLSFVTARTDLLLGLPLRHLQLDFWQVQHLPGQQDLHFGPVPAVPAAASSRHRQDDHFAG